jgi:aarF domain-containing kinase
MRILADLDPQPMNILDIFCSSPSLRSQGIDMYDVSRKIGEMYSKMIFDDGYVHCDPHPGNVLVRKNQAGKTEIVLLDHGLYTQLSSHFR